MEWLRNLFKRTKWRVIHSCVMSYNNYWDNPDDGYDEYCSIQFLISNKGKRKIKLGRRNDFWCNWKKHHYYQYYAIPYLQGVNIEIIPKHKLKWGE